MAKTTTQETAVAANDAYTGMLAISLVALIVGCVFLYLDWSNYPDAKPPRTTVPKIGAAPAVNQPPVVPGINPMVPMVPMPPMVDPAVGERKDAEKKDPVPEKKDALPEKKE